MANGIDFSRDIFTKDELCANFINTGGLTHTDDTKRVLYERALVVHQGTQGMVASSRRRHALDRWPHHHLWAFKCNFTVYLRSVLRTQPRTSTMPLLLCGRQMRPHCIRNEIIAFAAEFDEYDVRKGMHFVIDVRFDLDKRMLGDIAGMDGFRRYITCEQTYLTLHDVKQFWRF